MIYESQIIIIRIINVIKNMRNSSVTKTTVNNTFKKKSETEHDQNDQPPHIALSQNLLLAT